MPDNKALVFASMVILVVLLALRGHFGTMPLNASWANHDPNAVSVRFAVHMAELHIRNTLASVGRIITIR